MKDTPINHDILSQKIKESPIESVGRASIRDIKKLVDQIEAATGKKYIRMEMGIPGLPPTQIGVEAEKKALDSGVAAIYPDSTASQRSTSNWTLSGSFASSPWMLQQERRQSPIS